MLKHQLEGPSLGQCQVGCSLQFNLHGTWINLYSKREYKPCPQKKVFANSPCNFVLQAFSGISLWFLRGSKMQIGQKQSMGSQGTLRVRDRDLFAPFLQSFCKTINTLQSTGLDQFLALSYSAELFGRTMERERERKGERERESTRGREGGRERNEAGDVHSNRMQVSCILWTLLYINSFVDGFPIPK